jgi:hypothetical protein
MDHRQVIAMELVKYGHCVKHILEHGGVEDHPTDCKLPDFIMNEEEKLKTLEKMRQAGELKRAEKSSVDRSTEAVASRLDRPATVIDAMDEMRAAGNQVELERAQKRLARVQRIADHKSLLANKVLTNTPQWILDEAKEQEAWIAQKKAEKVAEKARAAKTADGPAADTIEDGSEELNVECLGCGETFAWRTLAAGDGRCTQCAVLLASAGESSSQVPSQGTEEPALLVECTKCSVSMPWQLLQLYDGACESCWNARDTGSLMAQEMSLASTSCSSADANPNAGRSTWRAARRQQATAVTTGSGYPSRNV